MSQRSARLDTAAVLILILLCGIWGLQQVAAKVALRDGLPPVLQAGLRSAGATLLVWIWSMCRGVRLFEPDGSLVPGLLAALLFGLEFWALFRGLEYTTASRAVLFLYTAPFWVALGGHLFLPGERLRGIQAVGLVCAFAGIVAAFGDGLRLPTRREALGDLLVLAAALLWGATTVLVKGTRLATVSPTKTLLYQLAGSAALLLMVSGLTGERAHPGGLALASLAYQTLVVACVSYLLWFWLISRYSPTRLSAFTFLTPLSGMLAGRLLLGEPLTPALILALALVGTGIHLVNRPAAAAAPAEARSQSPR
jgi:drug/metabolite transporter (DMT)-like permease